MHTGQGASSAPERIGRRVKIQVGAPLHPTFNKGELSIRYLPCDYLDRDARNASRAACESFNDQMGQRVAEQRSCRAAQQDARNLLVAPEMAKQGRHGPGRSC